MHLAGSGTVDDMAEGYFGPNRCLDQTRNDLDTEDLTWVENLRAQRTAYAPPLVPSVQLQSSCCISQRGRDTPTLVEGACTPCKEDLERAACCG